MTALLVVALAMALWLILRPPRGVSRRVRSAFRRGSVHRTSGPGTGGGGTGGGLNRRHSSLRGRLGAKRGKDTAVPLTVVVQQLAALLKGGRTPSRLWDELWLVHAGAGAAVGTPDGPRLSTASAAILAAARGAALRGAPVAEAIRLAARSSGQRTTGHEPRIWAELAACFDIAEASGCPLADVLTRFAAQLEVEDDAEAARQTALAGPKATVTLLTWLPLLGLGLGICLGVDPLAMLVGTPLGVAALVAGILLTVAGRIWSARLVRAAAGAAVA
jgi:tight adherence protein B